jgi:Mg2+-importing ATPase
MGPLADYFRFVPLPSAYFAWLAVILFGYAFASTLMKRFYFRRYGW